MNPLILLRGGGDLASGVALRLHRTGFQVVILELDKPLAVRRTVSFSEAIYEGVQTVEGVTARTNSAAMVVSTSFSSRSTTLSNSNFLTTSLGSNTIFWFYD